jgi:hypothetical protein
MAVSEQQAGGAEESKMADTTPLLQNGSAQVSGAYMWFQIELGTEFRSEKIPRNRLGTISVIPRKKVLIPRHFEFRGRANSEPRNGTESSEKNEVLRNSHGLFALITLITSTFYKKFNIVSYRDLTSDLTRIGGE